MISYEQLLERKRHSYSDAGFDPVFMPEGAFEFQRHLITWAVKKGRAALFEDCGLGKSLQELTFAQNVVMRTNKPVLLLTPLAVAGQMVAEGEKFGIEAVRCNDGCLHGGARVVVTNYERLHLFNASDFSGMVCDESSILKNCDGVTKAAVTDFMRKMSFRLLCTATPSPNDLIELGNSSEALGYMGFNDMLSTFFKKSDEKGRETHSRKDEFRAGVWRFRGHAERQFYRWICGWARALRRPSDIGFDDAGFVLPNLITREHAVQCAKPLDGYLLPLTAVGLSEQRRERRLTLEARCQEAARRCIAHEGSSVAWGYLNDECDEMERMIPNAVQVSGADSMERKEEVFEAFAKGQILKLVTKPDIAGFGLNWQHCHHSTFFPSHSFEQFYQSVRRFWRFGQTQPVEINIITSAGEAGVLENLMRKSANAEVLFANLVHHMGEASNVELKRDHQTKTELPSWLC